MKTKAVKKEFNRRVVLDVPELEFEPGRICAVMGANGSGKSTFAASIFSGASDCTNIGYMPQKSFAYRMSVKKNLMLSCSEEKCAELMDRLDLHSLAAENAKNLSGGETAKLALGRVLGKHFDLLILDEPTASMDVEACMKSEKLILEYAKKENACVILITHSKGQAERIADRLVFLHKGIILEDGKTTEVLQHPQTKEAEMFFAM